MEIRKHELHELERIKRNYYENVGDNIRSLPGRIDYSRYKKFIVR